MDIQGLMIKHGLTGTVEGFRAALCEYEAAVNAPAPDEAAIISQVAGDVHLDQALAVQTLRIGGIKALHELAKKVRHQQGRPSLRDAKPTEIDGEAARIEIMRRKLNQRVRRIINVR